MTDKKKTDSEMLKQFRLLDRKEQGLVNRKMKAIIDKRKYQERKEDNQ